MTQPRPDGEPYPPLENAGGRDHVPAAPEQYPLITAYDATGAVVVQARLRPSPMSFDYD
jgi:hypothetical protein